MSSENISRLEHPYFRAKVVLTSKHDKYHLIAPVLGGTLEMEVLNHVADTDVLGTFSGEIERQLSPRQTAILKARIGINALGIELGIASEGSIGPDRQLQFSNSNLEYLVLVDTVNQIEIVETYQSFDIVAQKLVTDPEVDISDFLMQAKFPDHKIIVSPNLGGQPFFRKGIGTLRELEQAMRDMAIISPDNQVLLQSDFRAHCSPSRQRNIRKAAELLEIRLQSLCPYCRLPGWGKIGVRRGLECAQCGIHVSDAIRSENYGCAGCEEVEQRDLPQSMADPASCQNCNP